MLSMSANAQKTTVSPPSVQVQFMECKREYVKLSNERDTLKSMFADTLLKHRAERVVWKSQTESQVTTAKKTGRKQGFTWGTLTVLGIEALTGLYFLTR